jgi:ribosomal protein L37AE/L43A
MLGGLFIQERTCPRCGNRRTVRRGACTESLCLNCRYKWDVPARWSPYDPRTW